MEKKRRVENWRLRGWEWVRSESQRSKWAFKKDREKWERSEQNEKKRKHNRKEQEGMDFGRWVIESIYLSWDQPYTRSAGLLWRWLTCLLSPLFLTLSEHLKVLSLLPWTDGGIFSTFLSRSGAIGKQGICLAYLCTPRDTACWLKHLRHPIHIC